jgi:hypothetical protein
MEHYTSEANSGPDASNLAGNNWLEAGKKGFGSRQPKEIFFQPPLRQSRGVN